MMIMIVVEQKFFFESLFGCFLLSILLSNIDTIVDMVYADDDDDDDDDDATQAALQHRDNPSKGNCCPGHGGGDAQKG